MCCICVKPAGAEMPANDILRLMAKRNSDGYGFVSSKGKNCKTMNLEIFLRELARVSKEESCIVHMRWATHGSVSQKNCHPFYDKDTKFWFAHNGVLPIASKNDMTDSEIAFRETIVPAIKKHGVQSQRFDDIVNNLRGSSRFALLKGDSVYIMGDYSELDGCYYSNLNWLPRHW